MPKILHPKLLPGNSPQFVLALQSPLYQAAHASSSRALNDHCRSKPTTRSRTKIVGLLERAKRGAGRGPTGPVRGMRGLAYKTQASGLAYKAQASGPLRKGLESDWVNVMISMEPPSNSPMHNGPVEVEEVACDPVMEPVVEVKEEIEDEAPLCMERMKKRPRTTQSETDEPSSNEHASTPPRIESHLRSQLPEAHISEQLREAMEKAQDYTEPNQADECAPRSRSDRHVRFLNCVTLVLQESSGFLKQSAESGSFLPSYDELRNFQCNAKRLLDEVDQGIHLFRTRELQRINAEKAKAESDAAAERSELVCKIETLKQENATVRAECSKLEMQVERLSSEKAEAEKKLEAEADKGNHAKELAKEFVALHDRFICQMCNRNPRDGLILPCLHLLYCYQCLEKHKAESKECPWSSCRCRISALLQCSLTGDRTSV